MIIGCDLDGCLADFNSSFIRRIVEITSRDLFPPRPFDIPTWHYPQYFGYTKEETTAVWTSIKQDQSFWLHLAHYPTTVDDLRWLFKRQERGDDLYFITNRPGIDAKRQTEHWLSIWAGYSPTVLISSEKGLCAKALNLDIYIDDRWENCVDVVSTTGRKTTVCCFNQPWNRHYTGYPQIRRIDSISSIQFQEGIDQ